MINLPFLWILIFICEWKRLIWFQNDIANKKLYLICNVIYNGNYCDKIVDDGKGKGNLSTSVNFRKPAGIAAVEISNQFTFRGGKAAMQDPQNTEISCPFMKSENETETLLQTLDRLRKSKTTNVGKSDDRLVVELGVIFGGDAALQVNKHAKCHHHKRNHHR